MDYIESFKSALECAGTGPEREAWLLDVEEAWVEQEITSAQLSVLMFLYQNMTGDNFTINHRSEYVERT